MKQATFTLLFLLLVVGAFTQSQLGVDIDGEAEGDQSGTSVALSSDGTIVAIGAYLNDATGGDNTGHVRVYQFTNNTWSQLGVDIDGEAEGDRSGTSVALSSDGTILAIGAVENDGTGGPADDRGHVRIYQFANNTWTQMGQDIDGETDGDRSGGSIALSSDGTVVAIGAIANSGANGDIFIGHVRVYQFTNNTWTKIGQDIDGEAFLDQSGRSVSLSSDGSIVAIGSANNAGANGGGSGHVRVYELLNNTWTQVGLDIDGEAAADNSGISVSLSSDGNIVAIGAISNNDAAAVSGHVRVYEYDTVEEEWQQRGGDIDGEAFLDQSGSSVSLSAEGDRLAIGAIGNDGTSGDTNDNRGHVRIYQYDIGEEEWQQIGVDIDGEAAADNSGNSVFLSSDGSTVAIGAPFNGSNNEFNKGQTRVYDLSNIEENCPSEPIILSSTATDTLDYITQSSITSTQSIESDALILYQAGTMIVLQTNFHAKSGSTLTAKIEDCSATSSAENTSDEVVASLLEKRSSEENELKNALHIFPNPFSSSTNIQFYLAQTNDLTLTITDMNGRVVHQQQYLDAQKGWQQHQFEASHLPDGMYFLHIRTTEQQVVKQLIIQK